MRPKDALETDHIRESGRILASILQDVCRNTVEGITTAELAEIARKALKASGATAPFLNYGAGRDTPPFPSVICISLNDEVVHGIPGDRKLKNGDVVGLDFGVNFRGMITDSAVTVAVGSVSREAERLIGATRESLQAGINQIKAGSRVGDVSAAIQARLELDHLGIVEELAGHGVGHSLHEEPWIPNFGKAGRGTEFKTGMTVAIEPMATLGRKDVMWHRDGWTISTVDGSLAAHFEHTVLVTENGHEILTQWQ